MLSGLHDVNKYVYESNFQTMDIFEYISIKVLTVHVISSRKILNQELSMTQDIFRFQKY